MQLPSPKPGAWRLFRIWTGIGLQSFGGGTSTTLLIQRTFIDKYHWMTIEDYVHFWNLSLFAPGINLVALTILIGKRLGGTWGVFSSLVGLLLPSATITCLLTASFVQIEHVPAVQAILKGIVPATVGVTALVSLRFAQPEFKLARQEGFFSVGAGIFIILACTLATLLWKAPVFIILPAAGLLGIIFFKRHAGSQQEESRTHD